MRSRVRVQLDGFEPTLTDQAFKSEADINNIVKRYRKTGVYTHVTSEVAKYGDYSDVPDFHTAMNIVAHSQQQFDLLPAALRKRFGNDPAQFLDFVGDSSNESEARSLGLLKPLESAPIVAPQAATLDSNTDKKSAKADSTIGST